MSQADTDFAPILATFPESVREDCGMPLIITTITDAESDPVSVTIHADGSMVVDTQDLHYLMLDADVLARLSTALMEAQALYAAWDETPSGIAWHN